jgi:hypothetical protein
MKRAYFSTRELVFAALTVVAMQIWTIPAIALTLPSEMSLGVMGLSNMAVAPVCSLLMAIALVRLRKPGSVLLITGLYGAAAMMGPGLYITLFILMGGVFSEVVCTLAFRGYYRSAAVVAGPTLYHVGMFPATLFLRAVGLLNNPLGTAAPWAYAVALAGITIAALAGSLLGLKVAQELVRAGKLRSDAPDPGLAASTVASAAKEVS